MAAGRREGAKRERDSHTGYVLIRVHLQDAAEQSVTEVSLRAKESYII